MSHSAATKLPKDSDLYIGKMLTKTKAYIDEDVVAFGYLSLDFNPLHFSEELAQKTRFKGRIIHGHLTTSLFSGVLSELTPWCVYLREAYDFTAPVRIGDILTADGEITGITEKGIVTVFLVCYNQKKELVARGEAIMKKMKERYRADSV